MYLFVRFFNLESEIFFVIRIYYGIFMYFGKLSRLLQGIVPIYKEYSVAKLHWSGLCVSVVGFVD